MKYVVLMSGGLDSVVLAALLKDQLENGRSVVGDSQRPTSIRCLFIEYGQAAARAEFRAAAKLCGFMGLHLKRKAVTKMEPLPDGYTYPARNLLLVSYACGDALAFGGDAVALGCTRADHDTFPDCARPFLESLSGATSRAYGVEVRAPLQGWEKQAVWDRGIELLPVDLLDETYSCYEAGGPCGVCLSCEQRVGIETC